MDPDNRRIDPDKLVTEFRGEDPSIKSIILFDVSVKLIVDHHQAVQLRYKQNGKYIDSKAKQ